MFGILSNTFRLASRTEERDIDVPGDWRPPTYWQRKPYETRNVNARWEARRD